MDDAEQADQGDDAPTSSRTRSGARARSIGEKPSITVNSTHLNGSNSSKPPTTVKSAEEVQSERMQKELEEKKWIEAKKEMRIEVEISDKKFAKVMRRLSERTNMDDEEEEELERNLEEEREKEKRKRLREQAKKRVDEIALEIIRDARKKALEEEKEEEGERQRREQEQTDVQRLQAIQTNAQLEEHESEQELKRCRLAGAAHQRMWEQEKEARVEKEKEEADAIEKLKKEIEEREKRLEELGNEQAVSDAQLEVTKTATETARKHNEEKRASRRKATRDVDLHPYNQAACFSRACTICTNGNPRERVTLVECGHVMCTTCAEETAEAQEQLFKDRLNCPFCRKRTKWVKMYEQCEPPYAPKRANDGQDEASPAKKAKE